MYESLKSKVSGGTGHTHLTSGTLFTFTGDIEFSIWGVITTETEAAANTCKLSVVSDSLSAVDLCATKDLNHLHPGTLLHITGTLSDNMIGVDVVGVAIPQAIKSFATCITSGIITVTYGTAAKDGGITWYIDWIRKSQNASVS